MPFLPLLLGLAPTVASWIMGDKTGAAVSKVTGIAREILGTDDAARIVETVRKMASDEKRKPDLRVVASNAAMAAAKNASVAPQLLFADILFVLEDAFGK